MAKKSSTSALTAEQHAAQDARYAESHEYDYVFIGTGNAALTAASLLVHAGKKVCMLEYHDIPGGYMQTFDVGDYSYCAQVHYTWGCGPGGKIYEFLKKLGLEEDITFELYDDGYDHMIMPDGTRVEIPYGYDKLAENIDAAYPGQKEAVDKFCKVLSDVRSELRHFPERKIKWWEYVTKGANFKTLIKYRNKSLQDLFDECGLSKEAQLILCANAGDFMEPPERLSIFAYAGLFGGYNIGAYYPTGHYKYYVERLAKFIEDGEGCHIYYETPVSNIVVEDGKVTKLETANGKSFTAETIVCNMDPKAASEMIGTEKFSSKYLKKLDYEYSPSGMVMYLGLKPGFDLKKYGLGKFNIWHCQDWDMNETWKKQLKGDFDKCWFFISTPNLHSDAPGTAPEGCQIMEIATLTDYDSFKNAQDGKYVDYAKMKLKLADHLLDMVEKYHVPELRQNIVTKTIGTPTTNEDFVMAPRGNAYGSAMTPGQMGAGRLKADTPFDNFYWCNASSGFAGMYGTAHTGMLLYMDLTGDRFYSAADAPTDDEFIARLRADQK